MAHRPTAKARDPALLGGSGERNHYAVRDFPQPRVPTAFTPDPSEVSVISADPAIAHQLRTDDW